MFRYAAAFTAILSLLPVLPARADDKPHFAGPTEKGFLLPNGWTLAPAGKHVTVTDLPLNIIPLAGGKHALIATSGYNKHELSLIDLTDLKVIDSRTVRQSWFGLALDAEGEKVWWSGGGANVLHTFTLKDHKLARTGPPEPDHAKLTKEERDKLHNFRSRV